MFAFMRDVRRRWRKAVELAAALDASREDCRRLRVELNQLADEWRNALKLVAALRDVNADLDKRMSRHRAYVVLEDES